MPLRRSRGLAFVASALAGLALTACDRPVEPGGGTICTLIAVEALTVVVTDAATGVRVCDATVSVVDGGFTAILRAFGPAQDCSYAGPTERAGRYEVRVARAGYQTTVRRDVLVTADECHVIPVRLDIPLPR